jgi:hypothetical protein
VKRAACAAAHKLNGQPARKVILEEAAAGWLFVLS